MVNLAVKHAVMFILILIGWDIYLDIFIVYEKAIMNASMNTDEFVKELLISHQKVLCHITFSSFIFFYDIVWRFDDYLVHFTSNILLDSCCYT